MQPEMLPPPPPAAAALAVELRSEEVQDILAAPPNWMLRWGSTAILAIIGGILVFTWVIQYPDLVSGPALLTTAHEPAYVYARASGNIRKLHVRDQQRVREGQLLAEVSSPVKKPVIDVLQQRLRAVSAWLRDATRPLAPGTTDESFGDIQPNYNLLNEHVSNLRQLYSPYYAAGAARLRANADRYEQLLDIYGSKLAISQRELANARRVFAANKRLFDGQVISRLDLIDKESALNQKSSELENVKQAIVQTTLLLADQRKQLAEWEFTRTESIRKLRASVLFQTKIIEAYVQNWKLSNGITAPAAGRVVFIEKFSEGFYARTDKPLMVVVPADERVIAKVKVPSSRYGKVMPGQRVRLTLDNYPFQEYGLLMGVVRQTSYIPLNKQYELIVELPRDLVTSYGRRIDYKPNMIASADVVLEDQRLIEKLLYSIRQLARRS